MGKVRQLEKFMTYDVSNVHRKIDFTQLGLKIESARAKLHRLHSNAHKEKISSHLSVISSRPLKASIEPTQSSC